MIEAVPGAVLGGRYRLEEPVGDGGMATVWRARDLVLERAVAVKVPKEHAAALRREATAAAGLSHPGITAVHDYGEDDLPYVVMELLDGRTLAARLAEGTPDAAEAARIGAGVAAALAAAHRAGVVHRDIKPANVVLTPDGVKVLDFGIAFTPRDTGDGPLFGTPGYLAPELASGAEPAPSADVYSLGVVLREMGLGGLDVVRRSLDPIPEARPAAAEVAADLGEAPAPVPAGSASVPNPPTKVLDAPPSPARRPLALIGGIVAALVLVGLVLALATGGGDGATPRAAAPPATTPAAPATRATPGGCAVRYAVVGRWPGGFQAQVRVTNAGDAPVDGWRLTWTFAGGQEITQLWNGSPDQRGDRVTVTAADYNRALAAGATAEFGFLGKADAGGVPAEFALNGTACQIQR
ncbi:protein kinase domain-containing protein [Actinomadura parmotrematis]|uniref:non-specific serine/threonine protein kinase n=1 Tax=Actinomadura parmotrematis TaxID=2864039 RepID=A0ABS7FPE1_9ACTN|nr:cellulose binding domain-containing protein [Actinomadura parmotrematis]MBW8482268.1 cellulose binding domain-containing protein [Actinomadura parmotrematis]